MLTGSIVTAGNNDKLFQVKGIINGKDGRKIAILEELCRNCTKANFAYIDTLNVVWEPKVLVDKVEEYDISSIEETILMDNMNSQ
ncbi:MAG: hypothetical protein GXW85_04365 [Clostridia bacterium]|nr:hypothetical protein [Clostridia bacterium]